MLYIVVLVAAVEQSESALRIRISPRSACLRKVVSCHEPRWLYLQEECLTGAFGPPSALLGSYPAAARPGTVGSEHGTFLE